MSGQLMYMIGIRLADYVPGETMDEPCLTCWWARPAERDGYNARCTKHEWDLYVGILECKGKNRIGFQRQYEFEEIIRACTL